MIKLFPAKEFRFPVIAECINPDIFEGKTREEIGKLEIWEGNKQRKLGELFKVEENKTEHAQVAIHGNVGEVRRIGKGMKGGEITVEGDVGMQLGEEMKDGKITVKGNVGGWAGSMMKGGAIEIHGNAGNYLSAPYRGCSEGMHGGKIVVYGDVGVEAGARMKSGIIKVYGGSGQFAGFRMCDGTLYVQKDAGDRAGACMTGGKIVIGGLLESVLPSFTIDSIKKKVKIEEDEVAEGPFYLFLGDLVESGDGKLYVLKEKNPQLAHYENFL